MKFVRLIAILCLISLSSFYGAAFAEELAVAPAEGRFKDFYSDAWFGTYALREFDKVAPPPGMNWYVEDAQDWLARATREGWVVKEKPSEGVSGSIVVGYHEGLVWVGVAREVTDQGLIFETVMGGDGKPARYWLKFSEMAEKIHFKGFILPQRLPNTKISSPMADYQGVRGATGAAWPVHEFDKLAPKPGFNWKAPEKSWAVEASRKGWKIEKNVLAAKPGSLLLLFNAEKKQSMVAIVRRVVDKSLVFDFVDPPFSRVVTTRLTVEQLSDKKAFGGFVFDWLILPERTSKK